MRRYHVVKNGEVVWATDWPTLATKKCDLLAKHCEEGKDELYLRDNETGEINIGYNLNTHGNGKF